MWSSCNSPCSWKIIIQRQICLHFVACPRNCMALQMLTTWDDYCFFIMEGRRIFGIRDGGKRIVPLPQCFRLGNFISNKASMGNWLTPCNLDVFTGILKFKVVALLQILHYFRRLFLRVHWGLKKWMKQIESCFIRSFLECSSYLNYFRSYLKPGSSWGLSSIYLQTSLYIKMLPSAYFQPGRNMPFPHS